MNTRFYRSPDLNIERIARDLESVYFSQDYQVQHFGSKDRMVIQLKMGSQLEAVIGMQAALTLTLQRFPRGIMATVGQQQWIDKAAAGALGVLVLWPLAVTAGVGAIRQANLESQLFNTLDTVILQQRSDVKIEPVPPDIEAQAQQQASSSSHASPTPGQQPQHGPAPGTEPQKCANCGELHDAEDLYCSRCGKPLTLPKKRCPACKAEAKPNATFCTKCGMSMPS